MDILQSLKKEHSKKQTDRIVKFVGADAERFAILIELFFNGGYRITQRAAWPLSYCVREYPELIRPYFKRLLDNLARKDIPVAVIRNMLGVTKSGGKVVVHGFVDEVQQGAATEGMTMIFPADDAEISERDRKLRDGDLDL